ncbi:tRNA glutamyl-Q(34) synthetase GluQRS [Noviherbaspirillum suwonense]|uniref:Glutamyl-Q tRNA(Asp) synthetase n=1 Tax=Noviherbaspirillum suwonense TaxID=1224511 RepID=A0ABY1Q805_9BURK|nr:tRNA glutamyl-Q(34) synthetase GluQRS [Noviherbaspirillum suwonense]SMP59629.1 glutamyl-Q tRNA(Asp) synthetase [Noviherbaspirillum suwonense]
MKSAYRGRFAPSPTGPLHAGSLVAAVASCLDARAHDGAWLLRIEDIDETRALPDAVQSIMQTLQAHGMQWDEQPVWQSRRKALYQAAFEQLGRAVYPCGCSRREIADSRIGVASDGAAVYPGTCRAGLAPGRAARAWRLRVPDQVISFDDRWAGPVRQRLATEVGDFVLKRADGYWAYQLAVVVDDGDCGITDIVRGADLLDSTARQIYLQRLLGLPTPRYMHVPVLVNERGEKLSKQTGAAALDTARPLDGLMQAAGFLGLSMPRPQTVAEFWQSAVLEWKSRHALPAPDHGEG